MIFLNHPLLFYMLPEINLNYKNFGIAVIFSLVLALIILSFSLYLGKNEFFLLLNTDLGRAADYFFLCFTNCGDAALWSVWLIIIFTTKRQSLSPLILFSFILTTIFTQAFKYIFLPVEARPSTAFTDLSQIHFVKGVTLHSINSFPSGHTATAFTFVLLIALTVKRIDIMFLAFIVAIFVGYSRIYLGQHFPLDVGAGIIVSVCSVSLALMSQRRLK